MEETVEPLVAFVLVLVAIPFTWWSEAFAIVHIWHWYRSDFVPDLPFRAALGLSFVVLAVRGYAPMTRERKRISAWRYLGAMVMWPWFTLLMAWIAKLLLFHVIISG